VFGNPFLGRQVGELHGCDDGGVDLLSRLDRVASIDHESGLVPENDCRACGAGEAGEPGQTLGALRHILTLVLVGPRHDEAVEAAAGHLGTQLGDMSGALCGRSRVVEELELSHAKQHRGSG
jgi:hypothetical protein